MLVYKTLLRIPADFEGGTTGCKIEDGGAAMICYGPDVLQASDTSFFVRLQSWDDHRQHHVFKKLMGKTVAVTVTVVDDDA